MKIVNEEIERLMRVVSESLRLRWEKARNQNQSLLTAKQERETALAQIKQNEKKSIRIQKLMFCSGALSVLAITYLSKWLIVDPVWVAVIRGIPFSMTVACVVWLWRLDNKNQAARRNVETCEEMFARFSESVGSLNCLGQGNPHFDVLDESAILRRLISAAYRVLAAQDDFESIRIVPDTARHSVIHAGNWIGHCENAFDQIWNTATIVFGLTLDKGEIYRRAAAELAKDKATRASTGS